MKKVLAASSLGLMLLVGCAAPTVEDAAQSASVEEPREASDSAEPVEVESALATDSVDGEGLHRFPEGDAPISEVFQQEEESFTPEMSLAGPQTSDASAPSWCHVNESCDWCGETCGLLWPLGGTYVYYGNIIWQNDRCYCKAAYAACEWISGCAG
jgi:hypothetical protein